MFGFSALTCTVLPIPYTKFALFCIPRVVFFSLIHTSAYSGLAVTGAAPFQKSFWTWHAVFGPGTPPTCVSPDLSSLPFIRSMS